MGKVFLRMNFQGYQVRKGFLVFYIHLVVDSIGIFFPTGEGVSLITSGLLGVSFLLGYCCHARIPARPDWRIRTEVHDVILSMFIYCILYYTGTLIDLFLLRAVPVPVVYQQFL